jgi:hypothetical protein
MAKYNEILVGRFNRGVQKLFGMKGAAPAAQLSGDIQVAHTLSSGTENRYLEGWQRYGFTFTAAAGGAGNRSAVRVRNPVAANVVAVLEKITYATLAPDQPLLTVQATVTDFTASLMSNGRFDPRGNQTASVLGSTSTNSGAIVGATILQAVLSVAGTLDFIVTDIQELTLLPGDAYTVWANALNQQIIVSIWWRERFLEESERT